MPNRKSLIRNVAALGSVQVFSYILPILTLVYVTRTLGVDAWGRVALAQAITSYAAMVIGWGFNLSATRQIATNSNDKHEVSKLFCRVWGGQWILLLISCCLCLLITSSVPAFSEIREEVAVGSIGLLATVMFPSWLYLGLENMSLVALVQIGSRLAAVPLIFAFVNDPDDGLVLIAINGLTALLGGLISLGWILNRRIVTLHNPGLSASIKELKIGAPFFMSSFWISLYTSLVPAVLGTVATPTQLGDFMLADRIRQLFQSAINPISQALYPRLSAEHGVNKAAYNKILRASSIIIIGIATIALIVLSGWAHLLVQIAGGGEFENAAKILIWMSPIPLIAAASNILGIQILLASGRSRQLNSVIRWAGVTSLIVAYPLATILGPTGSAINVLAIEGFVLIGFAWHVLCIWLRKQRMD